MKLRHLTILPLLLLMTTTQAQVAQKVVVEHFTNTRCGICSNRNPALFTNLNNHPDVIHMSYHPSKPYSSCVLNQHNVNGNDDRTKFYGVYGATPRIVIQGKVQASNVDFGSSSIFTNPAGKTTPYELRIEHLKNDMDSLVVRLTIKTVSSPSLDTAMLYATAVEDTIFYNAPNGEDRHYNVFRTLLFDEQIILPAEGDSLSFELRTAQDADWNPERMKVFAMIQNKDDKSLIQAQESEASGIGGTAGLTQLASDRFQLLPNLVHSSFEIKTQMQKEVELQIIDVQGVVIHQQSFKNNILLDASAWANGTYYIQIRSAQVLWNGKILKY